MDESYFSKETNFQKRKKKKAAKKQNE